MYMSPGAQAQVENYLKDRFKLVQAEESAYTSSPWYYQSAANMALFPGSYPGQNRGESGRRLMW